MGVKSNGSDSLYWHKKGKKLSKTWKTSESLTFWVRVAWITSQSLKLLFCNEWQGWFLIRSRSLFCKDWQERKSGDRKSKRANFQPYTMFFSWRCLDMQKPSVLLTHWQQGLNNFFCNFSKVFFCFKEAFSQNCWHGLFTIKTLLDPWFMSYIIFMKSLKALKILLGDFEIIQKSCWFCSGMIYYGDIFPGVIDTAKSKLHGVMTHGQCWVGLCGVIDIPESDSIVSLHQGGRFIWQLQSQSSCCHDILYELIVSKPYRTEVCQ